MIELLVVMAILGILMAFGAANYSKSLSRGRDAKKVEDMNSIQKGFELYYAKFDTYAGCEEVMGEDKELFKSGLPQPPKGISTYTYAEDCGESQSYCVCAVLENPGSVANSGAACDFEAVTKTSFCVENLQ